jgi:hypothetical protein
LNDLLHSLEQKNQIMHSIVVRLQDCVAMLPMYESVHHLVFAILCDACSTATWLLAGHQGGDFFLGGVIAGTLTKLMLRLASLGSSSGELFIPVAPRNSALRPRLPADCDA